MVSLREPGGAEADVRKAYTGPGKNRTQPTQRQKPGESCALDGREVEEGEQADG